MTNDIIQVMLHQSDKSTIESWSPIVSSLIALLAVFSSILTAWFTYRIGKRNTVFPLEASRNEMIRESIARFVDALHDYVTKEDEYMFGYRTHPDKRTRDLRDVEKASHDAFMLVSQQQCRLELALDQNLSDHKSLIAKSKVHYKAKDEARKFQPGSKEQMITFNKVMREYIDDILQEGNHILAEGWNNITEK